MPPEPPLADESSSLQESRTMTTAQLADLTVGADAWTTRAITSRGIRSIRFADGPHGIRRPHEGNESSLFDSRPATCFPTSTSLGSSWNRHLIGRVGAALGREARAAGVDVLLAPGLNLKRSPAGGRNFEYFSEDPLITSELGVAYIDGVQSEGAGACVKHFVANDTENRRYGIDVLVDERALRELYLTAFEKPVTVAKPATVMAAYSKLNGTHCAENDWLLNGVLRREWGFDGAVVSDWGAAGDRRRSVPAGLDIEMPGLTRSRSLVRAVKRGTVSRESLAAAAERVMRLAAAPIGDRDGFPVDAHHDLAVRAAAEGAVLLKNAGDLLPLSADPAELGTLAVIGAFAQTPRYQGAGSSHVVPTRMSTIVGALRDRLGTGAVAFAAGYALDRDDVDQRMIDEAVRVASTAAVAVVVVGLPESYETEGVDRAHLSLPRSHDALVEAVLAANARTVVVLQNGSPVEMPWREQAPAILETFLGGQAGGEATADMLLGLREPAGRLAETFPVAFADHPAAHTPDGPVQLEYWEGVYLGYRYFDTADVDVAFPFGHGLSYTSFAWSDFRVDDGAGDGTVSCSIRLTNTGGRAGSEVVQLYAHPLEEGAVARAEQQLVGFEKVHLGAGASIVLTIPLEPRAFSFWDVEAGAWRVQSGRYELRAAASSRDVRAAAIVRIGEPPAESPPAARALTKGHRFTREQFSRSYRRPLRANRPPAPGRYTGDTSLRDMTGSRVARGLFDAVRAQTIKTFGIPDGPQRAVVDDIVGQFTLRMLPTISAGAIAAWQIPLLLRLINLTSRRASRRERS